VSDARSTGAAATFGQAASRAARRTLAALASPFVYLGQRAVLLLEAMASVLRPPFRGGLVLRQMQFVGVQSLPIVALVGLFSGGVAADSALSALALFRQEAAVGGLVGVSLAREIAPVFGALMLSARAGAGMAAELGSMRLTEQVDALVSFDVDPVQALVMPRIAASLIMTPVLTMVFNAVGLLGAYFVAVKLKGVDPGAALNSFSFYTDPTDYLIGAIKALVFGVSFSLLACYRGLYVRGGATELGQATTRAVVEGAVSILILDYFLTDLSFVVWPPRGN
jgi:phospholipid/cholesterol/gamma-HCH transport system permease protein